MADDLIYVRDHEDYIEDYLSNKSKSFEDDIDHLNDALNKTLSDPKSVDWKKISNKAMNLKDDAVVDIIDFLDRL